MYIIFGGKNKLIIAVNQQALLIKIVPKIQPIFFLTIFNKILHE